MCIFLYFKFFIIYSYIILILSPMQIVFQPEELWRAKAKKKKEIQNHHRNFFCLFFFSSFFYHFIYTVIGVLNTTKTLRKRETTIKLKYSFPFEIVECYLQKKTKQNKKVYFHIYNERKIYTKTGSCSVSNKIWVSVVEAARSIDYSGINDNNVTA